MKRGMAGGAYRGPVAHSRQRRTIRVMQGLFVVIGVGLFVFAALSAADVGNDRGLAGGHGVDPTQPVVLVVLGMIALGAAVTLGGPGAVRVPTPARLDELAGRAEGEAVERAERYAGEERASDDVEKGPTAT